jgi:cytoplasmic iron level regulating protein YaaA (DUF328/UPF0246 family)
MRIIISPAKKMNTDTDSMPVLSLPDFLSDTELLLARLREMDETALKKLWACNDSILQQNISRLRTMDLRSHLTPAILSYEGIQYRYMAPGVFTRQEFDYVQQHLRILSGFYGVLRPFDGVTPYRLEMQAKLLVGSSRDLYGFWGSRPAEAVCQDARWILNLASKEYSICIRSHLPGDMPFITCVFGQETGGKVIEKGTLCKMARGEMVRWLARNNITEPHQITGFTGLGYRYSERHSHEATYVFLKEEETA